MLRWNGVDIVHESFLIGANMSHEPYSIHNTTEPSTNPEHAPTNGQPDFVNQGVTSNHGFQDSNMPPFFTQDNSSNNYAAPSHMAYPYMHPMNNYNNASTTDFPLSQPLYGATFRQAVIRFFKKYTRFSGYASRSEYWFATLWLALISAFFSVLYTVGVIMLIMFGWGRSLYSTDDFFSASVGRSLALVAGFCLLVFICATFVPFLALTARRLHDAGFSAWFMLLFLVPFGGLAMLVLTVLPSDPRHWRMEWDDCTGD